MVQISEHKQRQITWFRSHSKASYLNSTTKVYEDILKIEVRTYLKNKLNIDLKNIMIATNNGYLMLTKTKDNWWYRFLCHLTQGTRYCFLVP